LKVGIDVRELEIGKATGIGQYLNNFLKNCAKDRQDWEFILFGNQYTEIGHEATNINKIIVPEYITFWWDQVQLPYHLAKEKIDIFLTPYFKAPLFCTCKLVVIINDLIPLLSEEYKNFKNIFSRYYFKSLTKAATLKADKIITISNFTKKDILKEFRIPEEKIEVVYLNVDESYRPLKSNLDQPKYKYGISKDFILYIGNFNPHKNVSTLLKAYSGLTQEIKNQYKLVLGGKKDSHCIELEKCARQLEIEDNVIFTGFISEEHLPSVYNAASLFVFPSLYEGFGLPPLEAMACGTPVIASNTTSLPEVVGDAGILVDPNNSNDLSEAISGVLHNYELQVKLRKNGLRRAKEFTMSRTSNDILHLLEKIIFQDNLN